MEKQNQTKVIAYIYHAFSFHSSNTKKKYGKIYRCAAAIYDNISDELEEIIEYWNVSYILFIFSILVVYFTSFFIFNFSRK